MEESSVDINEYIRIYESGWRLDQIKPLINATYRLFRSSNTDVRIVSRTATYSNPMAFNKIKYFTKSNEFFYMIPITTIKGTITGFILRGVNKHDYSTVSRDFSEANKKIPLMFGFDGSFADYDDQCIKRGKSVPIIVCEGSKDCMMLKRIYPYVLANNTSSMGLNAAILRNISNRFLLAYDNDQAGQDGILRDKKILRDQGCYVDSLKLDEGYKDCADYLDNPELFRKLASRIRSKVLCLLNNV